MESAYSSDWEHRYDEDLTHNRYHEPMMFPEAALDNKGGFALIGFAECVQCVWATCSNRVREQEASGIQLAACQLVG